MKHVLSVYSIFVSIGGQCRVMLRNLRCIGSVARLIDVQSVCSLTTTQYGGEMIWHAL